MMEMVQGARETKNEREWKKMAVSDRENRADQKEPRARARRDAVPNPQEPRERESTVAHLKQKSPGATGLDAKKTQRWKKNGDGRVKVRHATAREAVRNGASRGLVNSQRRGTASRQTFDWFH